MLADIGANPACKQNPNGARTAHTIKAAALALSIGHPLLI
jgi:hypothetical protein